MTDTSEVIDRIHKLLNMTAKNGCTEDEAETALRMAAGLMAKHGIEEAQLSKVELKNLAKVGKRISQEFKRYQLLVAMAAGKLYGCTVLNYSSGKFGIEFVGREDHISAAQDTMFWLMNQLERFYKEALPRGMSVSERAKYRKTFKEACALRIHDRAVRLIAEMYSTNQRAQEATGQNALVVQGYFERLDKENRELLETMNLRKTREWKFGYGSGTNDGLAAGDRVQLRKELH